MSHAPRFALIDAIRGLAAVGIACYHIDRYGPIPPIVDAALPAMAIFKHTWIGVQCFFVIAGFVAAYSLRSAAMTPAGLGKFCLRRLARLGIPYWTVAILVASLNLLAIRWLGDSSLADEVTWRRFGAQLLFLPDIVGYENLSAGMWFVAIDLQFGLLLWLLLAVVAGLGRGRPAGSTLDRILLLLAVVPLAVAALLHFNFDSDNEQWILYFFHMPAFGAITWWSLEGRLPRWTFWAYLLLMLVGLGYRCYLWHDGHLPGIKCVDLAMATTAGLVLYVAGRTGAMRFTGGRVLQYLGRISYSLFLIHYTASWLVLALGYRLTGTNPTAGMAWMAAAVAASLAAAHVFYTAVEGPAARLSQRLKG